MSAILNNELFGWNLLYNMHKDDIKSAYDLMVAFVHWALVRKGFRCVGLGSDHDMPPIVELSECLPPGWSEVGFYKIRYIYNFEIYILASAKDMGFFCVNLMHPFDLSVNIVHFEYDIIIGIHGALQDIMPDYINILRKIQSNLILPFIRNHLTRDEATQASILDIAFDNTPRELEPIVRIFKVVPMCRSMSRTMLEDVLTRFEAALHYIRNPHVEPMTSPDDWLATDDDTDSETQQRGNFYRSVHQIRLNNQGGNNEVDSNSEDDTQADGTIGANGPNDDADLPADLVTCSDINVYYAANEPDFFGSLLQEEPDEVNADAVNEQQYLSEPLEPMQFEIFPIYEQDMESKLMDEIDNILAAIRKEFIRKLDPLDPQFKGNLNTTIRKPEEYTQRYLIDCVNVAALEGAVGGLSEEDIQILKLQKICLIEATDQI